ncbi:glycosyltransferase [Affinibrenneria salicis]|uniref:Glycosyltransferase n=1 Tax=Affinibrenneria salicis TaxID=2590031 RepID=A0A5J5FZW9_9GAMM|nr:glycosyltransferase [Affinibrenneria salicis]KAA8999851.1 glycosyltransferase [Affinibrenneria salicis]
MLISVAMATYNGGEYIKKQINSILEQTIQNIEVIIVDDCSTDNTISLIRSFQDSRIRLVQNKRNIGCSGSFQHAISLCHGDYIALCDQDDLWKKNKLERLVSNIGDNSLIYSDFDFIDKDGHSIDRPVGFVNKLHGVDSKNKNIHNISFLNSFVLGCSCLFDSSLKTNILPIIDSGYNHDKWIINVAVNCNGITYLKEILFHYRIHGGNLSIKQGGNNVNLSKRLFRLFFLKKRKPYYSYEETKILYLRCKKKKEIKKMTSVVFLNDWLWFFGKIVFLCYFNSTISARYTSNRLDRIKEYILFFLSR